MKIRGIQGHVAYPLETMNPMHALAQFVTSVTAEPLDEGNVYFPPTTFQMVNVHCDANAPNVVPSELSCRFNFRYSTEWTQESLSKYVENILRKLKLDFEVTWKNAGMPFITKEGHLTDAMSKAVREETGNDPELSTSGGTSDGRFIAPFGASVVEMGPLNETIHKVNEAVDINDIPRLEHIYYRVAELLLVDSSPVGKGN